MYRDITDCTTSWNGVSSSLFILCNLSSNVQLPNSSSHPGPRGRDRRIFIWYGHNYPEDDICIWYGHAFPVKMNSCIKYVHLTSICRYIISKMIRYRCGRDRTIVGFTNTCASCVYYYSSCEFEFRSWWDDSVPFRSWSYDSWIYKYLCNLCQLLLKLWVWIPLMVRCPQCKIVSDLRQVGGFPRVLRFPPSITLTATIFLKYCWKWRKASKT
jgi:hypothetical protein